MDALISDGKSWTGAFREHAAKIMQPACYETAGFRAWKFVRELREAYPKPHPSTVLAVEEAAGKTWPAETFDRDPEDPRMVRRLASRVYKA